MRQFGEPEPDLSRYRRYAAWLQVAALSIIIGGAVTTFVIGSVIPTIVAFTVDLALVAWSSNTSWVRRGRDLGAWW